MAMQHFPELPSKKDASNCSSPFAIEIDGSRKTHLICDRKLPLEWAAAVVWLAEDGSARALGRVTSVNPASKRLVEIMTAKGKIVTAPRKEVFRAIGTSTEF